jgi:MYXO-CTERM domain-containing protein
VGCHVARGANGSNAVLLVFGVALALTTLRRRAKAA